MMDIKTEAELFIYDLANLAKEHWFKPGENWALSLANDAEKAAIQKRYFPTLHIVGEADQLQQVDSLMRPHLRLAQPEIELPDERRERKQPPAYLIAFNPDRVRK